MTAAHGGPARRGPMVDLDPSGQVTQKEPDRTVRQFLNYAFFKVEPEFRRLPDAERREAGEEFVAVVRAWEERSEIIIRTYSLVGLRADADLMFWRISRDLGCFQEMQAALNRTRLGGFLRQPYNFLSLQKRSQYVNRVEGSGEGVELMPGQGKYLSSIHS